MAVLYLLSATAASAVTLAGFLVPRLRNLEKLLPDHDVVPVFTTGAEVAAVLDTLVPDEGQAER